MYKLFSRYGLLFAFIIGLVFILIFIVPVITGLPEGFTLLPDEEQTATSVFDTGLQAAAVLFIATVIITILASLLSLVKNPKGAIKGIIALAILLVVMFVLYSVSADEDGSRVQAAMAEFNVTSTLSQWISAFMKGSFIMVLGAIGIAIVGEILNIFK